MTTLTAGESVNTASAVEKWLPAARGGQFWIADFRFSIMGKRPIQSDRSDKSKIQNRKSKM
jgi:hypothetical protein